MHLHRYVVFICLVLWTCDSNEELTFFLDSDKKVYGAKELNDGYRNKMSTLWNSPYKIENYPLYLTTISTLLDSGYFSTAEHFSNRIDTTRLSPQKLSKLYLYRGEINLMKSKPDIALLYFRHAYINFPMFPDDKGYNYLKYYNSAVFMYLDAGNCDMALSYFDSLKATAEQYPELLYYIGGETRLEDFQFHFKNFCE